jgi:hypothetical protein
MKNSKEKQPHRCKIRLVFVLEKVLEIVHITQLKSINFPSEAIKHEKCNEFIKHSSKRKILSQGFSVNNFLSSFFPTSKRYPNECPKELQACHIKNHLLLFFFLFFFFNSGNSQCIFHILVLLTHEGSQTNTFKTSKSSSNITLSKPS